MSVEDAEARGIKAGDTVRCFNDFGSMLRIAQPMQGYMPAWWAFPTACTRCSTSPTREHHRPRRERADALRRPAVELLPPGGRYNSLLIEIEKYDGEPLVEDFERGPFWPRV